MDIHLLLNAAPDKLTQTQTYEHAFQHLSNNQVHLFQDREDISPTQKYFPYLPRAPTKLRDSGISLDSPKYYSNTSSHYEPSSQYFRNDRHDSQHESLVQRPSKVLPLNRSNTFPRTARTQLSKSAFNYLRQYFSTNKFPDTEERILLGSQLNVPPKSIQSMWINLSLITQIGFRVN